MGADRRSSGESVVRPALRPADGSHEGDGAMRYDEQHPTPMIDGAEECLFPDHEEEPAEPEPE
jgi:hypothetical protein